MAWLVALAAALVVVGVAYSRSGSVEDVVTPATSGPDVPSDPGSGCGEAAVTDTADLSVDRTLARCGEGAPEADPLRRTATLRVAVPERTEAVAPLLVADALGEFEAENLDVEIVEMDLADAYAAMVAGDVDVVVGGVDGPFFDAVHDGLGARMVLGGSVAREPGDLEEAQTGLWLRADLIDEDGDWTNVEGTTVLVAGGMGASALYPMDGTLGQQELTLNSVDFAPADSAVAADRLRAALVGGAWLPEPEATAVAGDEALIQVSTLPGSESVDGTVFAPRLLDEDRNIGLAYARAVIRTINTHLADGYGDEAAAAMADSIGVDEGDVTAGAAPLFDWEMRSGTTDRIQDSLMLVGGVGYERPMGESDVVDRTVYRDAVGVDDDPPAQDQG